MRLFYIVFSILITSCATHKMNVEKGTFQAMKAPNIYGNGRYLINDTNYIISFDANIGKNKTVPLPGLMNKYQNIGGEKLLETPANISYRLIENTLGLQFYKVTKEPSPLYTGFGGGFQNFPYGFLMLGYNGKFVEIGGVAFCGLALNKASYEGEWVQESGGILSNTYNGYTKLKDAYILHSHGGAVAHASFYWEKFALNYSASVSNPWLIDELPYSKKYDADVSFWFPVLLMQDIGVSYTPHKIKYRVGINQITGIEFPGQYWGLSIQVAYGW